MEFRAKESYQESFLQQDSKEKGLRTFVILQKGLFIKDVMLLGGRGLTLGAGASLVQKPLITDRLELELVQEQ